MPMTQAKLTIFFAASGGRGVPPTGWTETWYKVENDYKNALGAAITYAKARKEILGFKASILGVRVSDAILKRETLVSQLSESGGTSTIYTNDNDQHDPTQVDLLIRVEASENFRRSWFLAGLPDSVTEQLKEQGVNAPFLNGPPIKKVYTTMFDQGFCIRRKDPAVPGTFILSPITSLIPRMVRNRKRGRPFDLFHGLRA